MRLLVAFLSAFSVNAAANPLFQKPIDGIPAASKLGNRLLSEARRLADDDDDFTWIADYSIRYQGCHSIVQYAGEGDENGGGEENESNLYTQRLVRFQLCPSNSCVKGSDCSDGASYVVDLAIFVDAYTESKLEAQEYNCEMVRENCYCQDVDDDEACQNQCYLNEGMDYCIEVEGDEFDIQQYIECAEANQGENMAYFIGPYCASDGFNIYLGVFSDEACHTAIDSDLYGYYNYGSSLPYFDDPLITSHCIPCEQVDQDQNNNNNGNNNNNNNNNNQKELTQMCEEIYEQAGKCEENLDIYNAKTDSCTYIKETIYLQDEETKTATKSSSNHTAAKVFAWLFGISTLCLCVVIYYLHTKLERSSVKLFGEQEAGGALA